MKRHHLLVILSAIAFAVIGALAWHGVDNGDSDAGPPVDEVRVADLMAARLPDLEGKTQALGQWQGKVLVINFWAPWCPPCREEIPGFIQLQERHGARGLQFIGIALDEADKVQAFADETGINYPLLLGGADTLALNQAAGNRLGGLPYTLVIDRQGRPVASLTGLVKEDKLEALLGPLL